MVESIAIGEFEKVNLTAKCGGDWGDLPTEMPDIDDPMNQLSVDRMDWEKHVATQLREQEKWRANHIGNLPEENIFYDGLSPIDFLRAFHDKHNDLERIDGLLDIDGGDPYFAKMGLHKDHIFNTFTDQELDKLCYDRTGSLRWYGERIGYKMGCDIQEIPLVVLQAVQQINIEKSLGRNNFRNFMRNINKKRKKLKNKQDLDNKEDFKGYKHSNKKPEIPIQLTGKTSKDGSIILTWD